MWEHGNAGTQESSAVLSLGSSTPCTGVDHDVSGAGHGVQSSVSSLTLFTVFGCVFCVWFCVSGMRCGFWVDVSVSVVLLLAFVHASNLEDWWTATGGGATFTSALCSPALGRESAGCGHGY